jgi:hypothetical protein
MMKLKVKLNETAYKMVEFIEHEAEARGVSLTGFIANNYINIISSLFGDSDVLSKFVDIADEYAIQFGKNGSDKFMEKRIRAIQVATTILEHKYRTLIVCC